MKYHIIKIIGFVLYIVFINASILAQAQSMVEENAKMSQAFCEWSFKDKQGKEECPLIAMGIHGTGSNVMVFRLDGMTISLDETHGKRRVEIGVGGFWDFKSKWSGTYKEAFRSIQGSANCSMFYYMLSNGYRIKMKLCDKTGDSNKATDIPIKDFERRMNLLSRTDENWMTWITLSPHNPSPEDSVTLRVKFNKNKVAFISQDTINPPRGYAKEIEFWCDNAKEKTNSSIFYIDREKIEDGNIYELKAKSVFKLIDDIEYAEEGGTKRFMVRFNQCEIIRSFHGIGNEKNLEGKTGGKPNLAQKGDKTPNPESNKIFYLQPLIAKHNHGIACDYVARKESSRLGDILIATLLVEQKNLWINYSGKDIMIRVKNKMERGKIIGFKGELDSQTSIEGKSLGYIDSKDDMPDEKYKFTLITNGANVYDIDLISICDL